MRPTTPGHAVLARTELPSDTLLLARFLIGKIVVRETPAGTLTGRIVETEAYPVGDAASHAFRGATARNRTLFSHRGLAYVYQAYGISWMFNVSSEADGIGAGVLVRALEPLAGIPAMQRHRGTLALRDLTRGPGRLAMAFDIDRRLDGTDLCREGPLWLARDNDAQGAIDIATSVRIGITRDADRPLRFHVRGNRFVSGTRAMNT